VSAFIATSERCTCSADKHYTGRTDYDDGSGTNRDNYDGSAAEHPLDDAVRDSRNSWRDWHDDSDDSDDKAGNCGHQQLRCEWLCNG